MKILVTGDIQKKLLRKFVALLNKAIETKTSLSDSLKWMLSCLLISGMAGLGYIFLKTID